MYIDKNGKEHPFIHLIEEDTESHLKGYYFEDETNNFYSDEPIETLEEAERQLKAYFTYLNRKKEQDSKGGGRYAGGNMFQKR